MMAFGLPDAASDNLPVEVLGVVMMVMARVILWGKGHWRRGAQTSTCSGTAHAAATVCNGRSCQSQVDNEYPACKRSHLAFPLKGEGSGLNVWITGL
jgi:hypothetical protein